MIEGPLKAGLDAGFGEEWSKEHGVTAGAIAKAVEPPITELQARVTELEGRVAALEASIPGYISQIAALQAENTALSAALQDAASNRA